MPVSDRYRLDPAFAMSSNGFQTSLALSIAYMSFNFIMSILIVVVNKYVFYAGYNFSIFLTGLHFVTTWIGLVVCAMLGLFHMKWVPIKQIIPLSLSFVGFVVFNNLSLQYNSVGFYQLMKIMTTPVIVVVQALMYGVKVHPKLQLALVPVCVGVIMASVSDFELNAFGTAMAIMGVGSTSFYQIWVKTKQQDLRLDSYQLLFLQAPTSAVLVFIISFIFEPWFGPNGIINYDYSTVGVNIILSCLLAFLVNLSIFLVIGKTSPVAYNVVGHGKTVVLLSIGFLVFGESANIVKVAGIISTVVGIILYSIWQQNLKSGWENRDKLAKASPSTPVSNIEVEQLLADQNGKHPV